MFKHVEGRKTDGPNPFVPVKPTKPPGLASEWKKNSKKMPKKVSDLPQATSPSPIYTGLEVVPPNENPAQTGTFWQIKSPNHNPFTEPYRASYAGSANESLSSEGGQIELLRVRNLILETAYDFPDLRGRPGESAEDGVVRILEQYRKLHSSQTKAVEHGAWNELRECRQALNHTETMLRTVTAKYEKELKKADNRTKEIEEELKYQKKNSSEALKEAENAIALLEKERQILDSNGDSTSTQLRNEIAALNSRITSLNSRNQELKSSHEALEKSHEALDRHIVSLKFQNQEIKNSHDAKLKKGHEDLEKAINALKLTNKDDIMRREDQIRCLISEHEEKVRCLQLEHEKMSEANNQEREICQQHLMSLKQSLEDEKMKHKESMANLEKHYESERVKWANSINDLHAAEARIQQQDLKSQSQLREMTERLKQYENHIQNQQKHLHELKKSQDERREAEKHRLETELRKQAENLRQVHDKELYELRCALEEFKLAYAAKGQAKGLTDHDLTVRFNKLAQDIEDFARLEWDSTKESQWWREQLQQLHPRNTRKLKQKVVQNSVWISLREHIFRSPFRLFAEEQEWNALDKPWIEIYAAVSSPSQWPRITLEIEKSRYENAKQLRAAIDPSVKVGADDRVGQLKMTYEKLVAQTVNAIAQNVEKVATIREKERKILHAVVRRSAELWLECCSQRYRLMVTLAGGITDVLGVSQGHIRLVKLVFRPELRKFGNSHGDNLTAEEMIAGWRSGVEIYPPQRHVSG